MPVKVDVTVQPDEPKRVAGAGAVASLLAIGGAPAELVNLSQANLIQNTNLSAQNAVAHQQTANELGVTVVAKTSRLVAGLGAMQARSSVDVLSNDDLAQTIADLKGAVAAFSSASPPVTPVNPLVPAGQAVYVTAPVYLLFDNEDGLDNVVVTVS